MFKILLQKEIVYSEAFRGKWVTLKQALFDRLPGNEPKELLHKVLLAANLAVVSVPSHVMEVIAERSTFTEITAHVTRVVFKRCPVCYKSLDRRKKLLLLRFCLRDCQFAELCDLELLPLSSGAFTTFSKQRDRIYISTPEHPKELLPDLRHSFLDDTVDPDIIQKLKDAAKQGKTFNLLLRDAWNNYICDGGSVTLLLTLTCYMQYASKSHQEFIWEQFGVKYCCSENLGLVLLVSTVSTKTGFG